MKAFLKRCKQEGLAKEEKIGFDQITKYLNRAGKDLRVAEINLSIDTEAAYNW